MRFVIAICVALGLVNVDRDTRPLDRVAQTTGNAAPSESGVRMVVEGMDLYMHDYAPTDGQLRKPTLWVHADRGEEMEGEEVWKLTNARAVIYGDTNRGTQDLVIDAASGIFDRRNDIAHLSEGVEIVTGNLSISMPELVWDNRAGRARSDGPVRVNGDDTTLVAQTMTLDPKTGIFVLTEVSGRLAFGGTAP
ncbi:MAG: LPS export ABC transporter periplasmic protein LptC [Candidatus Hydrogenedentes bacterium]|nr:LPS export ABC transporter periplasmic protein LptC [Candidatus Hydrogenedentota bacterium]